MFSRLQGVEGYLSSARVGLGERYAKGSAEACRMPCNQGLSALALWDWSDRRMSHVCSKPMTLQDGCWGYEARKPVNLRWPRPRRHGAQKPGVPQREGSACLRGIRSLERRV